MIAYNLSTSSLGNLFQFKVKKVFHAKSTTAGNGSMKPTERNNETIFIAKYFSYSNKYL
jgi:hypothetical protein